MRDFRCLPAASEYNRARWGTVAGGHLSAHEKDSPIDIEAHSAHIWLPHSRRTI
jgi:hypothetical protein